MRILLNSETYYEEKAVLTFYVQGRPRLFLARYVREQFGARVVGFRKIGDWHLIDIEYSPAVAELVVTEVRGLSRGGSRPIWG